MTENVRVCVLNARKSKKRFCSYLNDDFDCTAPSYETNIKNTNAKDLVDVLNEQETRIWNLKEENEQLKKELKVYRKVASCSNCHYHDYNWFDDGDEFEVCDKGNDVTDGICEEWEEF